jgi:hypothetical protein
MRGIAIALQIVRSRVPQERFGYLKRRLAASMGQSSIVEPASGTAPRDPRVQYFCHPCGRNFIDRDVSARKRYTVRAGMLRHERLSGETTALWR